MKQTINSLESKPNNSFQLFGTILTICASILFTHSTQAQSAVGLHECTKIIEDIQRLKCYDALMLVQLSAETPLQADTVAPASVDPVSQATKDQPSKGETSSQAKQISQAQPTTQAQPKGQTEPVDQAALATKPASTGAKAALPQDLGGSKFAPKEEIEAKKDASYRGKIVACSKGGDGKHFFTFDNGQIWKQVKSSKKRYKNCNFDVTVSKDVFGYKMAIDGRRGNVRINRKR